MSSNSLQESKDEKPELKSTALRTRVSKSQLSLDLEDTPEPFERKSLLTLQNLENQLSPTTPIENVSLPSDHNNHNQSVDIQTLKNQARRKKERRTVEEEEAHLRERAILKNLQSSFSRSLSFSMSSLNNQNAEEIVDGGDQDKDKDQASRNLDDGDSEPQPRKIGRGILLRKSNSGFDLLDHSSGGGALSGGAVHKSTPNLSVSTSAADQNLSESMNKSKKNTKGSSKLHDSIDDSQFKPDRDLSGDNEDQDAMKALRIRLRETELNQEELSKRLDKMTLEREQWRQKYLDGEESRTKLETQSKWSQECHQRTTEYFNKLKDLEKRVSAKLSSSTASVDGQRGRESSMMVQQFHIKWIEWLQRDFLRLLQRPADPDEINAIMKKTFNGVNDEYQAMQQQVQKLIALLEDAQSRTAQLAREKEKMESQLLRHISTIEIQQAEIGKLRKQLEERGQKDQEWKEKERMWVNEKSKLTKEIQEWKHLCEWQQKKPTSEGEYSVSSNEGTKMLERLKAVHQRVLGVKSELSHHHHSYGSKEESLILSPRLVRDKVSIASKKIDELYWILEQRETLVE